MYGLFFNVMCRPVIVMEGLNWIVLHAYMSYAASLIDQAPV